MPRFFGGIDPGIGGAFSVLLPDGRLKVYDTPTYKAIVNKKNRNLHDLVAMWDLIAQYKDEDIWIALEDVQPMPKFGSANFAFGSSVAYWQMALTASGIPWQSIRPQIWKREIGIPPRSSKGQSRVFVQRMFPKERGLFARVKDDGRADATLIAECLRRQSVQLQEPVKILRVVGRTIRVRKRKLRRVA